MPAIHIPWGERWKRLTSMKRAELADRVRQQAMARIDTLRYGAGFHFGERVELSGGLPAPRFFFSPHAVLGLCSRLKELFPQEAAAVVSRAESICEHRFDLLGYENLNYGAQIDWHSDLVHAKRAPRKPWHQIHYLDFDQVGDSKVTWELNRHQHFVTLAKAFRLSGEEKFAREIFAQWEHWHAENPYPIGINWASSLEVAFRSLSWIWTYFLVAQSPVVPQDFRRQWLEALSVSGRHIERYLSTYFSPNTHLLGEAVALFFIGTLCPELRSSLRWKQRGWEIVLRESERQVRPDGFYFEQSTYYHVYALDFLIHASVLASLNNMQFPKEYNSRLERMLDALALLSRAGPPPRWGDDDGGRVFDSNRNMAEHLVDPLATGAVLFGRGDFKAIAGGLREETLWLLGEKGADKFDRIKTEPADMTSIALSEAGLYVMSCNEGQLQAIVDAGPQGALAAGHGHADALSIVVHADGRELLGDPGTFEYVGEGPERRQFRGTAAHNTLQLDERDQSEPERPFTWNHLAKAKAENWISGQTFDLFAGSHDGYTNVEGSAIHRRWVFFRKTKFWLIRDLMLGTGEHQLDLRWHLNPELSPSFAGEGHLIASGKEGAGLALFFAGARPWSNTVEAASWSAAYGRKEPATAVRFTTQNKLPTEFATLLAPTGMPVVPKNAQRRLTQLCHVSGLSAYCFADGEEDHYFIFSQSESWAFSNWKSDAEFFCCCGTDGKLSLLIFCNGTYVEFRGRRIVSSDRRTLRCEIICSEGKAKVVCPEDDIELSEEAMNGSLEIGETVSHGTAETDC